MLRESYERKVDQLIRWSTAYYSLNESEIPDAVYDEAFREVQSIEAQYPEWIRADSPTLRVGGMPLKELPPVAHRTPMLSIENALTPEEARAFVDRMAKALGRQAQEINFFLEPKYDGLSLSLWYEDGLLVEAVTRGDGEVGESVLHQARTIRSRSGRPANARMVVPSGGSA